MSVHYLLDGYNVVKTTSALAQKNLKTARETLIHLIEMRRPQGSIKNSVTIVFDGQEGIAYGFQSQSFVKVIFSAGETADDKIRALVQTATNKKNLIVVTNDRELGYAVKALGSQWISVEEFLKKGAIKRRKASPIKKKKNVIFEEKHISKTKEHRITTELEKIWLKHEKEEGI